MPAAMAVVLAFVLSACGGGAATPAPTPTPSPTPVDCLAAASGGPYLRSDGSGFVCDGRRIDLTGFTFYPALVGGTKAWHSQSFATYIDHILEMGDAAGQNLVRPTDQWDKTTPGQSPDDQTVWSNMDYLIGAARRHGDYVVVDLSAYRWLLMSKGMDPWDPANWVPFVTTVGQRYRNENAVAFYSISGEPTPPSDQDAMSKLLDFYRVTTDALRAADPNHLITVGGFNHMEDESAGIDWWQQIYRLPGNDLVAVKTYSQHDLDLMPAIAAYARSVNKPVVDEEFGMPQGYGDGAFAGGQAYNGLSDGRAAFFDSVYKTGGSLGFAGYVFWNMGCQVGAESYEVSPLTPAVWDVIRRHGGVAAHDTPASGVGSLCQ